MVPVWAVWPYETMIVSKRHIASLLDFTAEEKNLFGSMLGRLTTRYDNLFETDFPYSAGLHQRPSGGGDYPAPGEHWKDRSSGGKLQSERHDFRR